MRIEKLSRAHDRAGFDCGEETLNRFLREIARQNARDLLGVTYVLVPEVGNPTILGYYTLGMAEVFADLFPPEARPRIRAVPAVLLARLATSVHHRGLGLGKLLVVNCIERILRLSDEVGVHGIVVDALNKDARSFYTRNFPFLPLADDPNHLYLPLKTARTVLEG